MNGPEQEQAPIVINIDGHAALMILIVLASVYFLPRLASLGKTIVSRLHRATLGDSPSPRVS